jgi:hypothetical protein
MRSILTMTLSKKQSKALTSNPRPSPLIQQPRNLRQHTQSFCRRIRNSWRKTCTRLITSSPQCTWLRLLRNGMLWTLFSNRNTLIKRRNRRKLTIISSKSMKRKMRTGSREKSSIRWEVSLKLLTQSDYRKVYVVADEQGQTNMPTRPGGLHARK